MSKKRFTTKGIIISNYGVWDTDDKPYANDEVVELLNGLNDEIMSLRAENTIFKLVVGEIIKDMQKYVDNDQLIYIHQSYVDWIKENVDMRLYSERSFLDD